MALFNLMGRLYVELGMLLRTGLSLMAEAMVPHDVKLMVMAKIALFG